jgi:hypothetical protein
MEPARKSESPSSKEPPEGRDSASSGIRYGEGPKVAFDHDPPNNPIAENPATTERDNRNNVAIGSLWMIGITVGLFFLPTINGLIGGTVGGYMVGSTKRALMASILPAIVAAACLWILLSALNFPVIGFFVGAALGVHIVLSMIGVILGAAIGGTLAQNKIDRFNRA